MRVLSVALVLALALCAAAQAPGGSLRYATVREWAAETNHTLQMVAAAPELLASYEDPAWTGTVFAIEDRVWEVMARVDGQGTFENMLYQIENNATYRTGFQKIVEYNVVQGEAPTHADLADLAAHAGGRGHRAVVERLPLAPGIERVLQTMLDGSMVTLIPAGQEVGNVTVLPTPDVFAGNATVIYLPLILLPRLIPA
ncbi:hypothetical protein ABPG75_009360 [Micractinium tetrahymenae]